MLSSSQIAKAVLNCNSYTHKKLQKLCYYTYCWYLTIKKEKLSETKFEAWIHGPVSPEIYQEYKMYGWSMIPKYEKNLPINSKILKFIKQVVEEYQIYDADELEKMSHKEKPWKNARIGYGKYESSNAVIIDDDIIKYYEKHELYDKFKNCELR